MITIGKIIGSLLWIGGNILMFIFWLMAMSKWLGFPGTILVFILAPGLVIFPIVFLDCGKRTQSQLPISGFGGEEWWV